MASYNQPVAHITWSECNLFAGYTVEDTENTLAGDVGGLKAVGKKLLTVDASQGDSGLDTNNKLMKP